MIMKPFVAQRTKKTVFDLRYDPTKDENFIIYFIYKQMKYIWDDTSKSFTLLSESSACSQYKLFPPKPLSERSIVSRRALFELNEIAIRLTPISQMLLSECLNPFYCFQAFSCALWFVEEYYMYASCILIISTISLLTQVFEMRRNERALKKTITGSSPVSVCREVNGAVVFQQFDSTELVPGDLIEIPRQGCLMHCDAFVLTGNCIVNESSLTGECVPVTKTPLPDRQRSTKNCDFRSQGRHILFGGTSVIQTRNFANERVLALVARTGFRTTKGELVRSILFPRPMKFKFTQDAFRFVGVLAGISVVGLVVSIYLMLRTGVETFSLICRCLDLITIVVPPALPVAMTVGIVFAQRRLRTHGIYCINPSVINVCGVINVTCFDKTGTLTEDGMDLWGVVPNDLGRFGEPQFEPNLLDNGPLLEAMASCHSLTRIGGILSGDPLDLKMFQSTKWEFQEEVSEDHCKFDMAVPAIVRPGFRGSMSNVTLESTVDPDILPYEVGILRQFPFTSSLQRMSVIARVLNSSQFSIYTKGAPEMIQTLCRRDTIPCNFQSVLLEYTREGYRVLGLAWRPLKVSYMRVLRITRERAEHDLLFLGFLVMENRLKPESAPVIQTLRNANIRPVMVTGDNMLTAVSVARDCEIIDELDRIIIVSAKPPPGHETSKLNGDKSAHAGGDVNHVEPFLPTSSTPSSSGPSVTPILEPAVDNQPVPLVEFHYAEDLHKPVTEVTATSGAAVDWRGVRAQRGPTRRVTMPESDGAIGPMHRWLKRFRKRPGYPTAYCSVSTTPRSSALTVPVDTTEQFPTEILSTGNSTNPVWAHPPLPPQQGTRVNIRMIDGPDFHLAISGKSWAVIKQHYPWLIPKLVVKGTVFSRFSPDQKTQLIEALQSVGYFVAMCGDGANDCGALKAAHAGIALSEAEASVASPFTSKQQNISCVPTLIREGRCALVTSFGTFKFICGYSLVQFFTTIVLYTIGSNISDGQFLFIDLFLITTLSVTFGYTKAYPYLSVEPPNMRLLSSVTMSSLGFQLLVNCSLQLFAFVWTQAQPWYIPLIKVDEFYELKNYENAAVFIVSSYQYIILAVVFSKSAPYRRSIFTNYFFIANLAVCFAATVYMTSYPCEFFIYMFDIMRIPSARFLLVLHAIVLANFFLCYLLEMTVEGVSFRRRLLHIRRALFPRQVQRKDYERIREEIDRLAGAWPPIIRSASVQALPRDLFNDGMDQTDGCGWDASRTRKRTISGMSTETEEEDLASPPIYMANAEPRTPQARAPNGTPTPLNTSVSGVKTPQKIRNYFGVKLRRRHSIGDIPNQRSDLHPPNQSTVLVNTSLQEDTPPHAVLPSAATRVNALREPRQRFMSGGPGSDLSRYTPST